MIQQQLTPATVVRTGAHWLLFDDEHVHKMEESQLSSIFGSPYESSSQTGYILFYERHEEHVIDGTLFNCAPIIESIEPRPVGTSSAIYSSVLFIERWI